LTGALTIKGEITGNEDLLIDAPLEGLVQLAGAAVVVGPNGRVVANINASRIGIEGDVQGSLHGAESVRIGSTGKTRGNISSRRICVEDGAEIHGSVEVTRDAAAAASSIASTVEAAAPRRAQAAASLAQESSAA
jgi:cytoskeletal protein CcmA (bactofilin family)